MLTALMAGEELSADDTAWAMDEIMAGNAGAVSLAAFAVLLRAKGETPAELAGLVRTMLRLLCTRDRRPGLWECSLTSHSTPYSALCMRGLSQVTSQARWRQRSTTLADTP